MESANKVNRKLSQAGSAIAAQLEQVGELLILPFRMRVSRIRHGQGRVFWAQSANPSANHSTAFKRDRPIFIENNFFFATTNLLLRFFAKGFPRIKFSPYGTGDRGGFCIQVICQWPSLSAAPTATEDI